MNAYSVVIIVIVTFALLVIAAFAVYKLRIKARIKGPFNTEVEISGSNEQPQSEPLVSIKDVKSRSGGLSVDEHTGGGISVHNAEVETDIIVKSISGEDEKFPKE